MGCTLLETQHSFANGVVTAQHISLAASITQIPPMCFLPIIHYDPTIDLVCRNRIDMHPASTLVDLHTVRGTGSRDLGMAISTILRVNVIAPQDSLNTLVSPCFIKKVTSLGEPLN